MNRQRINRARKKREASLLTYVFLDHATAIRKCMDRIDHHDEKLGIVRPIGNWKSKYKYER